MRWKIRGFESLINYIDKNDEKSKAEKPFTIYHNTSRPDIASTISDFKLNDLYRTKRKGGVVMYHEILSFHRKDSINLDMAKLEDIARKYIAIRGQNAICFAKPHFSTDHVHIHFAFTGTEYHNRKTLRMDNRRFEKIRRSIETYQLEHYPELSNSVVYINKPERTKINAKSIDRNTRVQREFEMTKRGSNKGLKKEYVKGMVQTCLNKSQNRDTFYQMLEDLGIELYFYREKINGVIFQGRKYRFKTLGLKVNNSKQVEIRLAELQELLKSNRQFDMDHTRKYLKD